MRTYLLVGLLVVAAAVGVAVWSGVIKLGVTAGACYDDDNIDTAVREGAVKAGDAFFDGLMKGEEAATYAMMAPALQNNNPREQFAAMLKQIASFGTFAPRKLEHAFYPVVASGETSICKVSSPDGAVTVSAAPETTGVHLLYRSKLGQDDWALTAHMKKAGDKWQVASFFLFMSSLDGKYSRDLMPLAKAQADKGHQLNAYMLYMAALGLANRGSEYRLGIGADADAALKALGDPEELKGEPPFKWTFGAATYDIASLSITSEAKQLGLLIYHADPAWDGKDEAAAQTRNRALIDSFVAKHPEYAEVFGFVTAELLPTGGAKGVATTWRVSGGYDATAGGK